MFFGEGDLRLEGFCWSLSCFFFVVCFGGGVGGGRVCEEDRRRRHVCLFFCSVCFVFRGLGVEDFLRGCRWFFGRMNNSISP